LKYKTGERNMGPPVLEYYQLEVLAGQRIIVPGCEPASHLSSRALSYAFKNQLKCGTGYVPLKKALANIPGSFVKIGKDWNRGNTNTTFFVFPAMTNDCTCAPRIDYYAILRGLATEEEPITTNYDYCSMNDSGYCPSPDFDSIPAPEPNPYLTEANAASLAGGILPPIPPWQIK
jgi:hypothetical protein